MLTLWRGRCAISGLNVPELLRASHAKPWASSTDAERLDVYNGLLLAAHLDAAFDCGLITVEADGAIGLSPTLPVEALSQYCCLRSILRHNWHRANSTSGRPWQERRRCWALAPG